MKTYAFVYSRGKYRENDYDVKTSISDSVCPSEASESFSVIAGWLNEDRAVKNEEKDVWVMVKVSNTVLWGIVCGARSLSLEYDDEFGRPIRGLWGVLIPDYDGSPLPFDKTFFKEVALSVMPSVYPSFSSTSVASPLVEMDCQEVLCREPFSDELNTTRGMCRVLPSLVDGFSLAASALSYDGDIVVAVGTSAFEDVKINYIDIPINAITQGMHQSDFFYAPLEEHNDEILITENHEDSVGEETVSDNVISEESNPKTSVRKGFGNSRLAVLLALLVLVIVLVYKYSSYDEKKNGPANDSRKESPEYKKKTLAISQGEKLLLDNETIK